MDETIEFLNKNIPDFAIQIYQKALQNYINKYDVLKQVPYSLQNGMSLSKIKLEYFLKLLLLLNIKETDIDFFWIGKLYFLLEMEKDWTYKHISGGSKVLQYQNKFICRLRPSIGYVVYLYFYYKKNKNDFVQMKRIIAKNQSNFYHMYKKNKSSQYKLYEIQTQLRDFKNKNMRMIQQNFKQDLGRFIYFKRIDQSNEEDRQKEIFEVFRDQQNYLKFKFKNITLKNHKAVQRDRIFKKNILVKNTSILFQNKFLQPPIGCIQKFVEKNEPKRKFLLKLSAQKKQLKLQTARSQVIDDINKKKSLKRQVSAQKIIDNSQKQQKVQKPKRLQVKKIIKQNQLQQFQQAQQDFKNQKLKNQKENFYISNNFKPLKDIQDPFKKRQNFLLGKETSKNVIKSKQFQLQLQAKKVQQKQSNIWCNFRSLGNLHFQDRALSAQNLPQTGTKLHSFNFTSKKKKKKKRKKN